MKKGLLCLVLSIMYFSVPAIHADDAATAVISAAVDAGFSELERQIIGDYYGTGGGDPVVVEENTRVKKAKNKDKNKGGLPPGLARKGKLPPGLERQLQKNGTLPPGLAKRGLPQDLEQQLPAVQEGYERQVVEDAAVVLVETATGKIVDVITDAIINP